MLTAPQFLAVVGVNKTRVEKKAASKSLKMSVNARNQNIAILKDFVWNQVLMINLSKIVCYSLTRMSISNTWKFHRV